MLGGRGRGCLTCQELAGEPGAEACAVCPNCPPEPEPDNRDAWRVFALCLRQWRRAGWSGRALGLDFAAVEAVRQGLGVVGDEDFWARMQWLEEAALGLEAP